MWRSMVQNLSKSTNLGTSVKYVYRASKIRKGDKHSESKIKNCIVETEDYLEKQTPQNEDKTNLPVFLIVSYAYES